MISKAFRNVNGHYENVRDILKPSDLLTDDELAELDSQATLEVIQLYVVPEEDI